MGILLAFIALVLIYVFSIPLLIYGCVSNHNFKSISNYFFKIAKSLDQLGNVIGGPLFNHLFVKKEGFLYGSEDETISSVTGRNHKLGTLTIFGRIFRLCIDICFGKNHCINSIGE